MNRTLTTLAVAVAAFAGATGSAFADEADASQYANTFNSVQTRAQVQADLAQYKAAGVNPWSTTYNPLKGFKSQLTTAQVRADAVANRAATAAITSEAGVAVIAEGPVQTPDTGTQFAAL